MTTQTVNVKIRVEPHAHNRHLWLIWYQFEGFESKKYWQLEGEKALKFYDARITFDEGGTWQVKAKVIKNDESSVIALTSVIVTRLDRN